MRQRVVTVVLIAAVALAFADASVVALALPDLYGEFDTTIVGVSWVLTTYALAVAVTAVPVAVLHRHIRPITLVVAGAIAFSIASLAAGAAQTLTALLVARAAQGVGATLLLAGSLPVLTSIVPEPGRARRWWALAGAVGAAVGPALGGVLTELFVWRAIFFVQAPVVALALLVGFEPAARQMRREHGGHEGAGTVESRTRGRDVLVANIGFALVFAALVAALFLGVLLAIEVWRYSPIQSALLVSALPVGMLIGRGVQFAPRLIVGIGGALLLALGLLALALVPGAQPVMAAIAFAVCGVGFDLVHEVLDESAVPDDRPAIRASAMSIGARHAGLVLGLALIAPVLSSSLDAATERATLGATQTMLSTDLEVRDKLRVIWALRTEIVQAPRGQVPNLATTFNDRGAKGDNAMARSRDELMDVVTDAVTRSFRPAFVIAAALAALSALTVVGRSRRSPRSPRRSWTPAVSAAGVGALGIVAVVLLGVELSKGARETGEFVAADPCTAPADPYPGDGLDASVQRIAMSTLNGAACELGTTRERLILSLDDNSGFNDVDWDRATMERALKVGAHRAIDDANDRDSIPGWAAAALGFVVDRAPVGWIIDGFSIPGF
jgi:MFS family permease